MQQSSFQNAEWQQKKMDFARSFLGTALGSFILDFLVALPQDFCLITFSYPIFHPLVLQFAKKDGLIVPFLQLELESVLLESKTSLCPVDQAPKELGGFWLLKGAKKIQHWYIHQSMVRAWFASFSLCEGPVPIIWKLIFFWTKWKNKTNCCLFSLTHVYKNDLIDLVLHD